MGERLGRTLKRNGQVYAAIGRRAKIGSLEKHSSANSFPWAACSLFKQRGSLLYNSLRKSWERITLPSTCSDWQNVHVKRKNVCKSQAWRLERKRQDSLRHDYFCENTGTSTIFERRFQPLSVGGFSSNQPESISWCPKSQKLKIDKLPELLL